MSRRAVLAGLAALGACGRPGAARGGLLAAGQPAALLIYALAPDRLLGWPRRPAAAALRLLPRSADLPQHGALTGAGAPASPEAVAALRPALVLDYGDLDGRYQALAERLERQIGAPYRLLDGDLDRTPQALRAAGDLLGVGPRARELADVAEQILATRGRNDGERPPTFYYARGRDGLETGFAGSLATEVLERAGWINVATGARDIGRVSREQVAAWDAEVVVTLDAGLAAAATADPAWRRRPGGERRRLLLLPEYPFGWIDRPPSINRLLGCAWLAADQAAATAAARRFVQLFYGADPDVAATRALLPRWL